MPHWEALLLRERGRLAHTRGDHAAEGDDLAAAIQILDDLDSRIALGRTLVLSASLNEGDAAKKDLLKARALFEACGAAGDLARLTDQRD